MVASQAYDRCLRIASRHYENFPVASRLLPAAMRPHVAAVYAFARFADDFADEGDRSVADRLSLLDDWQRRLDDAAAARVTDDGSDAAAIFTALAETMRVHRLETELFSDLLGAFRQDVTTTRYADWPALLDYCRRSANPVGRLVLRIAGIRNADADRESDHVCTALQLTNFWQDLERDWAKGRVYVPQEVLRAHGADESSLKKKTMTEEWKRTMRACVERARAEFKAGRFVADRVRGRLRWELRATWHGGMRILERIEAVDYDVFAARPTLGARDAVVIAWRVLRW